MDGSRNVMHRRGGGVVQTVGRTAVVAGTATAVTGAVSRRRTNKQLAMAELLAADIGGRSYGV